MRQLLVLACLLTACFCRKTFKGDQVLRVTAGDDVQINLLKNLTDQHPQLNFWLEPVHESLPVDVHVPFHSLQDVKGFLKSNKIQYKIMIQDLQNLVDEEQRQMLKSRTHQPKNTDEFDYTNYHTLSEIDSFMDMLVKENSSFVSKIKIGESVEKRPLNVLKFSNGTNRPGIWIDCGIHAREWISPATGTYFAKRIVMDRNRVPTLKDILMKFDIFLEIVVNPDGYEYTHTPKGRMWRKNRKHIQGSKCIGVDLNRNWDANFGGAGSSNDPCNNIYRGPSANSEPEVKAIVDFIKSHGKIKAFVSMHSFSQILLYPYGYTKKPCKDEKMLDKLAKEAITELQEPYGTVYRYGSPFNLLGQASGISMDWAYNQGIKYSYTFELRDNNSFVLPADQILPTALETWQALMAIMKHTKNNPY
ncbi:carboxypeptidase A1-like [Trichomycterus rosablanca]|uniref:carboxypeptidase A1-like n=1 Tax=Trichomycterus rosablanca TaxID=2290929 RepID=UPI002F35C8F2